MATESMMETPPSRPTNRGSAGAHVAAKDHRSAVTNGRRLHVVRPGDTAWARRFKDILAEVISDLGGHDAGLSEGQRQLARRATTISIQCERMEGEAAAGNPIDLEQYGRLTDRLGRCFQRLGLERHARNISVPTLSEIAREIEDEKHNAEDAA
jgi:hypothetical protein